MAKVQKVEKDAEKRMPNYVARARQAPGSQFWMNVGAAWEYHNQNGEVCYSVKINNQPVGWDGSFVMVPPLPPKET